MNRVSTTRDSFATSVVLTKERKAEMQDEITQQIAIYLAKGLEITKLASNQRKEDANVPQQDVLRGRGRGTF